MSAAAEADPAGGEAALVLHTERSASGPLPAGCERPRKGRAWRHEDGSLTPVRCGSPNLCRYCSWLTALENAYVVRIDAEACCPRIGFTLTTKAAVTAAATFRRDISETFRALRRQPWARDARYLGQIEFTTGEGKCSGGYRRIHQHGLLKDVDPARAPDVAELMKRVWLGRTGARRVEAHELRRPAGAMAYLVNHHQKQAQTPPRGWSGKRFRPSNPSETRRGYFEQPVTQLREQASAQLADKRMRATVAKMLGADESWQDVDADVQADVLGQALDDARDHPPPVLVKTMHVPQAFGADGLPSAWRTEVVGLVHDSEAAA